MPIGDEIGYLPPRPSYEPTTLKVDGDYVRGAAGGPLGAPPGMFGVRANILRNPLVDNPDYPTPPNPIEEARLRGLQPRP